MDIEALQAAGDHDAALAALDARLDADPDDARALLLRARSHAARGRVQRVLSDVQAAVARDPSLMAVAAVDPFLAPLADNPYLVLALERDGDLSAAADALRDGDLADALGLLEPLREHAALAGTAWFLIGVCHSQLGDPLATLSAADEVTRRLPTFPDGWFNRGWALEELGRIDEAVATYRRAVEVDAEFVNGWFNLAMLLRRLDRRDDEIDALDAALDANPDHPLLRYKRAEALAATGDDARAVADLERVLAADPRAADAIRDNEIFAGALDPTTLARLTSPPR